MAEPFTIQGIAELESDLSALDKIRARVLISGFIDDVTDEWQRLAQAYVGKRTGNLAQAIDTRKDTIGHLYEGEVSVDRGRAFYGGWVERGTGIYGPRRNAIRPTNGNVLVFMGTRGVVHARYVRGQIGQRYLERAYEDVRAGYLPGRLLKLKADIARLS
jgi:hypothetical protein